MSRACYLSVKVWFKKTLVLLFAGWKHFVGKKVRLLFGEDYVLTVDRSYVCLRQQGHVLALFTRDELSLSVLPVSTHHTIDDEDFSGCSSRFSSTGWTVVKLILSPPHDELETHPREYEAHSGDESNQVRIPLHPPNTMKEF